MRVCTRQSLPRRSSRTSLRQGLHVGVPAPVLENAQNDAFGFRCRAKLETALGRRGKRLVGNDMQSRLDGFQTPARGVCAAAW